MENNYVLLVILIPIVILILMFLRSRQILDSWAAENGYNILSSDYRWLCRGPYSWTLLGKQWVYYVVVRASDDTVRRGYVKCGSFWWGVLVNKSEVEWDTL